MASSLPSGTVTLLFTDIQGSTKRAREQLEAWEALSARHHAIVRAAIAARHGCVFQVVDDGFCAAFHNPRDAVSATATCVQWVDKQNKCAKM